MAPPTVHGESYDSSAGSHGIPTWLKIAWGIGLAVVVFLAGVTAGIMLERRQIEDAVVLDNSWRELGEVIDRLESDSYYRPEDVEGIEKWRAELERRAIDGLLQGSGDDYAAFLPPAEAAESSRRLTGEYEGIGVTIARNHEGEVEVVSIMIDSPADRADVRVGDIVKAVESTPIPKGDLELASNLLRGEAGTSVSVEFGREGQESYDVTLTREKIATGEKTVGYRYYPDDDVAVIQITLFALTTTDELDEALAQARTDGASRIVLDLRGNPGGWVSEAKDVIGKFVDPEAGPALLEDTWPAGDGMVPIPIGDSDGARYDGELIVLVDENTASSAEIVASALQHYDRAVVVGVPTFGKGSVQRVYDFDTGESLRLTVAEWFTPAGQRLQDVGVTPDVELDPEGPVEDLLPTLVPAFQSSPAPDASPEAATPAA